MTAAGMPGTTGVATFVYETGHGAAGPFSPFPDVSVHGSVWDGRFPNGEAWVQHGSGAVYSDQDGHVYAYACSRESTFRPAPNTTQRIKGSGRCGVARAEADAADLESLGERESWQYWSGGTTWTGCASSCGSSELRAALAQQAPLDMVGTKKHQYDQHYQVVYSDDLDAFVSVHQRRFDARRSKMVIRTATNPVGPWSRYEDRSSVPIACNGSARPIDPDPPAVDYTAFNCYQIRAHPALGESATSTVFGYFDTFLDPFPPQAPSTTFVDDAIRFASVPLCVRSSVSSSSVDYVQGRCFMQNLGTNWTTATVARSESAAIVWRLEGWHPHPIDSSTEAVLPVADREPASFVLNDSRDLAPFWSDASDFAESTPTTRGQFLRLLHRTQLPLPVGLPTPATVTDWDAGWGTGLKQALRWAYDEGITCATSANPHQAVTRNVAAAWVHRFKAVYAPCGDGP